MSIRISVEGARGCGYRKVGGLYLMGGGTFENCDRLPFELHVCAACGHGIKPTRGWTWVEPLEAFDLGELPVQDLDCGERACSGCPLGLGIPHERAGLLWIGGQFYATPADFNREAHSVGVSRRITAVPKDLVLGETWVYLAHREAIAKRCSTCDGRGVLDAGPGEELVNLVADETESTLLGDGRTLVDCEICRDGIEFTPAIFSAFVPTAIEQVVAEDCSDEEAEALRKRGIEPVIVRRADEDVELPMEGGEEE